MSSHRDARRAESAPRGRDGLDGSDRAASSQSPQPQPGDGAADDAVAILAPSRRDGRPSTAAPLAFESWGVHIVAMIVYWCCRALEESTDAFKKAAYVANAFWEEQVCGSGLAELLRHDTTRGVLLLSSVLPKLGSHASVLGALRSYVSAHGHEERPVASEEGVLSFPLSARDNAAHVTPEPQLGDGAAASAAAAAPLAFETWDFKGVATVVYRCCNAFAGDTDVFEKAAQVANAFWEAQVCGRALAELLHNDASRGDVLLAGVLSKLGSRAAVLGALRAYILEHGHEQWPVTSEAEKAKLSFPLSASRVEDRMTKYPWFKCSKSFDCFKPVACPGEFGKFVTTVGCLAENTFYTSRTEISATMPMPLLVTVNINELQEEIGNPDKVLMIGTLVIRSMFDTDTLVGVDGKQSPRPSLKVNGSEVTDEQLRLLSSEIEKIEGPDGFMRTTTYSLEVPTTRRNVFAKAPFNITSFQVALDFKPLVARLPNGKLIKFVPDLLCPTEDLRELISSKDEELDNLDKFDIINANPSVQVKLATTAKGMLHTPSIKITFYGDTDAVRAALNIIVPILFIAFGNVLNVWFSEDHDNFVANALTLGLTFVFFIPTLNQVESVSNELDLNQLLVVLIFLGLVLGCMDCKRCNGEDAAPLGIPN